MKPRPPVMRTFFPDQDIESSVRSEAQGLRLPVDVGIQPAGKRLVERRESKAEIHVSSFFGPASPASFNLPTFDLPSPSDPGNKQLQLKDLQLRCMSS